MSIFQIVSLGILSLLIVTTFYRGVVTHGRAGVWLLWFMLFVATFIAILMPNMTADIARFVGIGRGTDLVLYSFVVASLIAFFLIFVRMRRVDREITKLVRDIAIRHAIEPADTSSTQNRQS
ncbi:MAG: DUF2304 domain-containing protein [Myxococcales bacterium]|nr:MAG: DUF2304 domain-containing protein [Myxococcales bacterium]